MSITFLTNEDRAEFKPNIQNMLIVGLTYSHRTGMFVYRESLEERRFD